MGDQKNPNDKPVADAQRAHWQATYTQHPQMYGMEPSEPARHAAEVFRADGAGTVLELGAGHGRDALFFARKGFTVHATEFSATALEQLTAAARRTRSPGSYARAASSSTPSATPATPATGKASTTATASTNTAASPSTSWTRPLEEPRPGLEDAPRRRLRGGRTSASAAA